MPHARAAAKSNAGYGRRDRAHARRGGAPNRDQPTRHARRTVRTSDVDPSRCHEKKQSSLRIRRIVTRHADQLMRAR